MSYSTAQTMSRDQAVDTMPARAALLSADTITGDEVCNFQDEQLGKIQDIMIDVAEGRIRYVVLASGGFLGMGDHLFAVPWTALKQDKDNHRFMLDIHAERLKDAPGFDRDNWPDMADPTWNSTIQDYYVR